jgi:hypothetical protein
MIVKKLYLKQISTQLTSGSIKGQGNSKKYVFLILETDVGSGFSEIYCGTYRFIFLKKIIEYLFSELEGKDIDKDLVLKNFLHQPFISGGGIVEIINSAFYNCYYMIEKNCNFYFKNNFNFKLYASGGTLSSSIDEIKNQIMFVNDNNLEALKIRLDYRDLKNSLDRIDLLSSSNCNFAIDLIYNTNYLNRLDFDLSNIIHNDKIDNLLWIEEPVFPSSAGIDWEKNISYIKEIGYDIALGESLSSITELQFLALYEYIDIIQLDVTHNSDYERLASFMDINEGKKKFGIHNWGSILGQIQNLNMLNTSKNIKNLWWELPLYSTKFDQELLEILNIHSNVELLEIKNLNLDSIINFLTNHEEKTHDDYKWF